MGRPWRNRHGPRRHRDAPLLVALDWVEVRSFHTFMAAAVCSTFTVGRVMLDRLRVAPGAGFEAICHATVQVASKWG